MSSPLARSVAVTLAAWSMFSGFCAALEVGLPADVAGRAPGTRIQMRPASAWSAKGNCWLVVWREGDVTEEKSEIWCARVAADGKTMDPEGICVCRTGELADNPVVASDGDGLLVVWEDFRNHGDWDVRGVRVNADGAVADKEHLLVAGGKNNQCRPSVAFSAGSVYGGTSRSSSMGADRLGGSARATQPMSFVFCPMARRLANNLRL